MGLLSTGFVSTFVSKGGGRGIFLAGDQCAIPGSKKLRLAGLKKVSMKKEGRKTCEGGSIGKGRPIQGGYRDGCD